MSFNIIAEKSSRLNYHEIHRDVYRDELFFDFVPMPELGLSGGDALGICVPLKNANKITWAQLRPVLEILRTKFGCEVYELYDGQKLTDFNSKSFEKNLLLK